MQYQKHCFLYFSVGIFLLFAQKSQAQFTVQNNSGFRLYFEDELNTQLPTPVYFGFYDNTLISLPAGHPLGGGSITRGELRRWTIGKVYDYLATIIKLNGSHPEILVKYSSNTGILGMNPIGSGSPFFSGSLPNSGFIGGYLRDHIVSGIDPDPNAYDGHVEVDFGYTMNEDAAQHTPGAIDLFTVLLHESMHALGFMSAFDQFGYSKLRPAPNNGPYMLFDQYLYYNNTTLYTIPTGSFELAATSNSVIYLHPNNSKSYAVSSLRNFSNSSSLSHLDGTRDNSTYLMTRATAGGEYREISLAELEILCNLGFSLYGYSAVAPWGCGNKYPVGVNDSYTGSFGLQTFNVLSNDQYADPNLLQIDPSFGNGGFKIITGGNCLARLGGGGSQLVYTADPDFCGSAKILYRPMDKINGRKGSVASVNITHTCTINPKDPCNYVWNGDFEEGVSLDIFDYEIPSYGTMTAPYNMANEADNWWGNGTADLFIRGSIKFATPSCNSNLGFGIPYNFKSCIQGSLTSLDVRPGTGPGTPVTNNRYMGLGTSYLHPNGNENLFTELLRTPATNQDLTFEFWANVISLTASTSTGEYDIYVNDIPSYTSGGALLLNSSPLVVNTGSWTKSQITITAGIISTNINKFKFLFIVPKIITGAEYYTLVDDVALRPAGDQLSLKLKANNLMPSPNSTVNYTVTLCNHGPAITNPQIAVTLPNDLTYNSGLSAYPNHTYQGTLNTNDCVDITFTATVNPTATPCQTIQIYADIVAPTSACMRTKSFVSMEIQSPCSCITKPIVKKYITIEYGDQVELGPLGECPVFGQYMGWKDITHNISYGIDINPIVSPAEYTVYQLITTDQSNCQCTTEVYVIINEHIEYKTVEITSACSGAELIPAQEGFKYDWETPDGSFTRQRPGSPIFTDQLVVMPSVNSTYSVISYLQGGGIQKTIFQVIVIPAVSQVKFYNKQFNSPNPTNIESEAVDIHALPTGGKIVLNDYKEISIWGFSDIGYTLSLIDEGGSVIWSKRYRLWFNSLRPANLVVANNEIIVTGSLPASSSFYIFRHSMDGKNIKTERYELPAGHTVYQDMIATKPLYSNGNFDGLAIAFGTVYAPNPKIGIIKTNPDFTINWQKFYDRIQLFNFPVQPYGIDIVINKTNGPSSPENGIGVLTSNHLPLPYGGSFLVNELIFLDLNGTLINGCVLSCPNSVIYPPKSRIIQCFDNTNQNSGYLITGTSVSASPQELTTTMINFNGISFSVISSLRFTSVNADILPYEVTMTFDKTTGLADGYALVFRNVFSNPVDEQIGMLISDFNGNVISRIYSINNTPYAYNTADLCYDKNSGFCLTSGTKIVSVDKNGYSNCYDNLDLDINPFSPTLTQVITLIEDPSLNLIHNSYLRPYTSPFNYNQLCCSNNLDNYSTSWAVNSADYDIFPSLPLTEFEWANLIDPEDPSRNLSPARVIRTQRGNNYKDATLNNTNGKYESTSMSPLRIGRLERDIISTIYPNPNVGVFIIYSQVQLNMSEIKIFDMVGKEINMRIRQVGFNTYEVTLNEITSGMYTVEVTYPSDKRQYFKVIVK